VNKTAWLDAAEVFDHWRVVPRAVLLLYGGWVAHVTDNILSWYQRIPGAERTLEASGLAAGIITAVTGLFPWVYKIYSDAATDWRTSQPTASKTTVVSSTETLK